MVFVYRTSVVGPQGTPLSDYEEGALIKLNEGGSPVEFYVSKHDYESGLNGAGRTLVVRKDVYDLRQWHKSNVNAYATSDIDSWLNRNYKALLDSGIQQDIGTTKFYYTPGNGNTDVSTLERSVFMLSMTELGQSDDYANAEGSTLSISSTLQIANLDGTAETQWTRSPYTSGNMYAWRIGDNGRPGKRLCAETRGSRPTFTLPSTLLFNPDTNEVVA